MVRALRAAGRMACDLLKGIYRIVMSGVDLNAVQPHVTITVWQLDDVIWR